MNGRLARWRRRRAGGRRLYVESMPLWRILHQVNARGPGRWPMSRLRARRRARLFRAIRRATPERMPLAALLIASGAIE